MISFDSGPPLAFAEHFAKFPEIAEEYRKYFWYDWGPVFYRGRLTGDARLIGIGSDPGPTERLVGRTLVGDAGQRVQGFVAKLGLTHSYVLVNAYPVAVHPSNVSEAKPVLADPQQTAWRNRFYDMLVGPNLEAVVAFGANASAALELWTTKPDVPTFQVPHPSSHDATTLLNKWRASVPELRNVITPDEDGDTTLPNYGDSFEEADYQRIPSADLPFGLPPWMGDDSWGRRAQPKHNNCVSRPANDPDHTLIWQAPTEAELTMRH
ncbi:hypothetical protein [Mycobacterium sp. ACS4054]|uniref:hypothetical protein n=1 Tax=Mycobacterium sp. ACS4054 TaxID=1834119 RepID=UPI0009EDB9B1|nr:hypothetical protein [Mycobacterium sp. ACS4054]